MREAHGGETARSEQKTNHVGIDMAVGTGNPGGTIETDDTGARGGRTPGLRWQVPGRTGGEGRLRKHIPARLWSVRDERDTEHGRGRGGENRYLEEGPESGLHCVLDPPGGSGRSVASTRRGAVVSSLDFWRRPSHLWTDVQAVDCPPHFPPGNYGRCCPKLTGVLGGR